MKHLNTFRSLVLGSTMLVAGAAAIAQDRVDIGLYQRDGQLDVTVRPQQSFSGIFSSVVFTIRWDRSTGATLGGLVQEPAVAQYMAIARSGESHLKSNVH